VNKHLKALHIRFLPEQAADENISSREFLKKAEFINIDSLLMKEEEGTEGGGSQSGGSDNSGSQSGDNQGGGGNSSITPGEGD
jgi:uncharacterized membrane protein YgcG